MKIGIIGTGSMGGSVGRMLAAAGHEVFFGSSDSERAQAASTTHGAAGGGTYRDAAEFGELLILATGWKKTKPALEAAGDLNNKVLIDCSNPEGAGGLLVGRDTSGAEQAAAWAPTARVVKAFNHVYGQLFDLGAFGENEPHTLFYCGDDDEAKAVVARLIRDLGYDAVDAGPLSTARYIEPLAMLMVEISRSLKRRGGDFAIKLQRRPHE